MLEYSVILCLFLAASALINSQNDLTKASRVKAASNQTLADGFRKLYIDNYAILSPILIKNSTQTNTLFISQNCSVEPYTLRPGSWISTHQVYDDIFICLPQGFQTVSCQDTWASLELCGNYLQIHEPLRKEAIISRRIEKYEVQGRNPVLLSLAGLCAGTYHLWLMEYTRYSKIILNVMGLYVLSPSC